MSDELREFLARARGTAATARVLSLDELCARRGERPAGGAAGDDGAEAAAAEPWGLPALRRRLVELSGRGARATLTCAMGLVLEAQLASEPAAWILSPSHGGFYPPDAADSGVDLAALVVVRVPDAMGAARAAERLLRSGAFGLVVIDLGLGGEQDLSMAQQGRLVTLAQTHDAAVVCLTEKSSEAASIGSLVSLRAEALRNETRNSRGGSEGQRPPDVCSGRDELQIAVRALKDKRRGPGWSRTTRVRGPAGM